MFTIHNNLKCKSFQEFLLYKLYVFVDNGGKRIIMLLNIKICKMAYFGMLLLKVTLSPQHRCVYIYIDVFCTSFSSAYHFNFKCNFTFKYLITLQFLMLPEDDKSTVSVTLILLHVMSI